MRAVTQIWKNPSDYLRANQPENPVLFFAPSVLYAQARLFVTGFPGLVTYAVKSNPQEMVIENLWMAGVTGFDVASPVEIRKVHAIAPTAKMHYNNPVRTPNEIAVAVACGVVSYSVDSATELDKLIAHVPARDTEITVRFKLPVAGAAYNFGAKFGATVEFAAQLLARVRDAGFIPSLTFHPGTQCTDPAAWQSYIEAAAQIAQKAGVRIARLNVGGGFPSHREHEIVPQLEATFALIARVTDQAFGADRPALVCEPGRGLVGDAFTLGTSVKAVRDGKHVFLNDGLYGALMECHWVASVDRVAVFDAMGQRRMGGTSPRVVFGPTCDSVDRIPGEVMLSDAISDDDFVLFESMGAYSWATNTEFNGFGALALAQVLSLEL